MKVVAMLFISLLTRIRANDFAENHLKTYRLYRNYASCTYINASAPATRDFANWVINRNKCSSTVINDLCRSPENTPKSEALFVFAADIAAIESILTQIAQKSFWNARSEHHFFICKRLARRQLLGEILRIIWRKHVINFVVVYVTESLQISSYNPFTNRRINLTEATDYFPDKLKDLNGYELRISFFDDFPLTFKQENGWYGRDFSLLRTITAMLNATFRIVEPEEGTNYDGAYEDVMDNKTDFCFISHFQLGKIYQDAEFSYPHEPNGVAVLMPMNYRKNSMYLLFDLEIWVLLGVAVVTIAVIWWMASNKASLIDAIYLISFTLLGYSIPHLDSARFTVKLQIIKFIVCAIIIRTAFQCSLVSYFIKSSPIKQINSVSQLQRSEIKITISKALASVVPLEYDLHGRFIHVTRDERVNLVFNKVDTSGAYGMTWTQAKRYTDFFMKQDENVPFYVMDEILVPGYNTYIFQKHSPFLDKISKCLMVEKQHSLIQRDYLGQVFYKKTADVGDFLVLKFHHLQHIFYMVLIGLTASCAMFILEVVYFYMCDLKLNERIEVPN